MKNSYLDFYDMGKHTITWNGSYQSSGMYFVRLESGEFIRQSALDRLKKDIKEK